MTHQQMASTHSAETQTARGHAHQQDQRPLERKASARVGHDESLSAHREVAAAAGSSSISHVIAQAVNKRRQREAHRLQAFFSSDASVPLRLTRQIVLFVPAWLFASRAMRHKLWLSVLERAAAVAIRQAHRAARQHGLKHDADIKRFLEMKCAWYVALCGLSGRIFSHKSKH